MYISGIPVGLVVDTKGPRYLVLFGAVCLGVGYFVLYRGMRPPSEWDDILTVTSVSWGPGLYRHAMAMLFCLSHWCRRLCRVCSVNQDMYDSRSYTKLMLIAL